MPGSHAGSILVARPELEDPNFRRSVIYLIDHNNDGAYGVVLNRPLGIAVSEHLEFDDALAVAPSVFFEGGPVAESSIMALGSDGDEPPMPIDIDHLLAGTDQPPLQLRFFAGYSGWSAGQLEAELASDAWFVVPRRRDLLGADDVFGTAPGELWRTVLRRQPGALSALALYPDDLMAN